MKPVTESQWLDVLSAAIAKGADDGGAMTTAEIADSIHRSEKAVRVMLRLAVAAGTVELTWVQRRNLIGVMTNRPAFRLVSRKGARRGRQGR